MEENHSNDKHTEAKPPQLGVIAPEPEETSASADHKRTKPKDIPPKSKFDGWRAAEIFVALLAVVGAWKYAFTASDQLAATISYNKKAAEAFKPSGEQTDKALGAFGEQVALMRTANALTGRSVGNAQKMLAISERSWRDSRRAFLEFVKPFGELINTDSDSGQIPPPNSTQWRIGLMNRGVITSLQITLLSEPASRLLQEAACRTMPTSTDCCWVSHNIVTIRRGLTVSRMR